MQKSQPLSFVICSMINDLMLFPPLNTCKTPNKYHTLIYIDTPKNVGKSVTSAAHVKLLAWASTLHVVWWLVCGSGPAEHVKGVWTYLSPKTKIMSWVIFLYVGFIWFQEIRCKSLDAQANVICRRGSRPSIRRIELKWFVRVYKFIKTQSDSVPTENCNKQLVQFHHSLPITTIPASRVVGRKQRSHHRSNLSGGALRKPAAASWAIHLPSSMGSLQLSCIDRSEISQTANFAGITHSIFSNDQQCSV